MLAEKVSVSNKILQTIRARLPEGRTPGNINEILAEGDIHVTKDAWLKIRLIDEYTGANNGQPSAFYSTPALDSVQKQVALFRIDVDIVFSGEGAGGAYVDGELSKTTVRLFNDALVQTAGNTKTTSVRVTTTFRKPYPKSQFRPAPYNPFITTASKDREVHLTNYSPTLTANKGPASFFAAVAIVAVVAPEGADETSTVLLPPTVRCCAWRG